MLQEKLMFGLSTTVIGMLVVFIGLIILIACIYCTSAVTRKASKKANAPTPEQAPALQAVPAASVDDPELIAVITAAIAAVWQGENSGFVVRRVRHIQNSTPRARSAREEQLFSHF